MKIRAALGIVAKGFCMGAADVVPGVSGGTMAFILGIYTRFIDAIKSFDLVWAGACLRLDWRSALSRPDFRFLLPLVAGIFSALLFFTHVVPLPRLLVSQPELVYGLFFGLISGSIVVLFAQFDRWYAGDFVPLVIGLLAGAGIVTAVPADTPDTWWFYFRFRRARNMRHGRAGNFRIFCTFGARQICLCARCDRSFQVQCDRSFRHRRGARIIRLYARSILDPASLRAPIPGWDKRHFDCVIVGRLAVSGARLYTRSRQIALGRISACIASNVDRYALCCRLRSHWLRHCYCTAAPRRERHAKTTLTASAAAANTSTVRSP